MRELALFAGAGGGILGGFLLGWSTVCAVEIDPYCRSILLARQRDGHVQRFPIWDDVCTFDGRPWRGHVDVISGGFPCQDISSAGRGAGIEGERSGLWREFARIVREIRPAYVFVENSPMLASRGLGVVLGDLAALGFDARWDVLGARHVGAPHRRDRMWIVAAHPNVHRERACSEHAEVAGAPCTGGLHGHADGERERRSEHESTERSSYACHASNSDRERSERRPPTRRWEHRPRWGQTTDGGHAADSDSYALREQPGRSGGAHGAKEAEPRGSDWRSLARFQGVVDGHPNRMDRVRATGNGQVPRVAALAWRLLSAQLAEAP